MRIFELRFSGNNGGAIETFDSRFVKLLGDFLHQLGRNGLILDGGVQSFIESGQYVCRVIAQDDEDLGSGGALSEENMNYDTRKALMLLKGKCASDPELYRREKCVDIPHCTCSSPSHYVLQYIPEWMGSPVMCGDCHCSVPLYKLANNRNECEFDDLLRWRKIFRGFIEQYRAGINGRYSYDQIRNCRSEFAVQGKRISGKVEQRTGVVTFYPIYSLHERKPEKCPQCGSYFVNDFPNAIIFDRCCRNCRIVM